MRISDWSSDVCSSDLHDLAIDLVGQQRNHGVAAAHGGKKLLTGKGAVMRADFNIVDLAQLVYCLLRNRTGYIDIALVHLLIPSFLKKRPRRAYRRNCVRPQP